MVGARRACSTVFGEEVFKFFFRHVVGVWTLPPVSRTSDFGEPADPEFDRAPYDAIGESDRMTLLFRKPAGE